MHIYNKYIHTCIYIYNYLLFHKMNQQQNIINPTYFQDWLLNIFSPTILVYATPSSERLIEKNNLSPAEYIRPFTFFTESNISFSVTDKFSINMRNFRLDTYDYNKFRSYSNEEVKSILSQVLLRNEPNVTMSSKSYNPKRSNDILKTLNRTYDQKWYNEYEKVFIESMFFNDYEAYQQPFGYIFICSISDSLDDLKKLKKKENIPLLLAKGIYEVIMPSMILILNDPSENKLSPEEITRKVDMIKSENNKFFVFYNEINTQSDKDIKQKDIWSELIHKIDYYNPIYKYVDLVKGELISLQERENMKAACLKFVSDYLKSYLQKKVSQYDQEVTEQKKKFKLGQSISNIFKKADKVEYDNQGIYKLIDIEKKILNLSLIQFYFRDYEDAADNLKILIGDLKTKSVIHYNVYCEMYFICLFLCGKYKDIDFDSCFVNYQKTKSFSRFTVRSSFIHVRMLEHQRKFIEIPKVLVMRMNSEASSTPFLHSLPFEKAAYCFIMDKDQIVPANRKFCFYMFIAGVSYFNQSEIDLRGYSLNCFNIIKTFFKYDNPSFLKIKEYLQNQMAEFSMKSNKFELASEFYVNSIYLSLFKPDNNDQQVLIYKNFIKSTKEVSVQSISNSTANKGNSQIVSADILSKKYTLRDVKVPEIINSTIITYEEQDYSLFKYKGWKSFMLYSKIDSSYINLTESDMIVLKNLDFLSENRLFKNKKKVLKSFVGKKIYVKMQVKNSFNSNIYISSFRLITQYEDSDEINSDVEVEMKGHILEMRSINSYTLHVIPKKVGNLAILGVELKLFEAVSFRHFFVEYDIRDENQLYRIKFDKQENYKLIKYIIQNEESDIICEFEKQVKVINQHEKSVIPLKIRNNSMSNIKKFCIFFDNDEIFDRKYMLIDQNIKKDDVYEKDIPLCPRLSGKYNVKIIIKFEDENKFKEIEIKRFIYQVNIQPSLKMKVENSLHSHFHTNKYHHILNSIRKSFISNIFYSLVEENIYLVCLSLCMNQSIFSLLDINSYELYIKTDTEFNWVGIKRRLFEKNTNKNEICFQFVTDKKGFIDCNKIHIMLNFNEVVFDNTNIVSFDHLPVPLTVDIE